MDLPTSLFDRIISRPRYPRLILGGGLLLLLAPIAAYLGQDPNNPLSRGQWSALLLPPSVILYIFVVAPRLARMGDNVITSFRPQVLIDDASFNRLVREAATTKPRNELIAFGVGVCVGLVSIKGQTGVHLSWFEIAWLLSTCLMYGILAWTIYASIVSTRVTAVLIRQPLRVDPFDITPFEAIGRQSLLIALVFVGGITLSLLFVAAQAESFRLLEFWIIYIPMALVPVLLFFLNMQPTHKVLVAAKQRELGEVHRHIQQACRELVKRIDDEQETGSLAAEINALEIYDHRLQAARTWPYKTSMLRTLFFSVLIPLITALGRMGLESLFSF